MNRVTQTLDAVSALTDGRHLQYKPEWNDPCGTPLGTILFLQILFRWKVHGRRPFYKFKEPCTHPDYRTGDSWTEELGFSPEQLDTARAKFAHKVNSKGDRPENLLVYYWTDINRLTYYEVNEVMVNQWFHTLYQTPSPPVLTQETRPPYTGKDGLDTSSSSVITSLSSAAKPAAGAVQAETTERKARAATFRKLSEEDQREEYYELKRKLPEQCQRLWSSVEDGMAGQNRGGRVVVSKVRDFLDAILFRTRLNEFKDYQVDYAIRAMLRASGGKGAFNETYFVKAALNAPPPDEAERAPEETWDEVQPPIDNNDGIDYSQFLNPKELRKK